MKEKLFKEFGGIEALFLPEAAKSSFRRSPGIKKDPL
jgi:hypothetical protein